MIKAVYIKINPRTNSAVTDDFRDNAVVSLTNLFMDQSDKNKPQKYLILTSVYSLTYISIERFYLKYFIVDRLPVCFCKKINIFFNTCSWFSSTMSN